MPTATRLKKGEKYAPYVSDEVALVLSAALLALWIGCLLWASLASHLPAAPRLFAWDKLQHFTAYAILMFFSGHFIKLLLKKRFLGWIVGFIFTVGFGLLMEFGQETLTITRHADWKDFTANSLGAGMVLLLALIRKEKKP